MTRVELIDRYDRPVPRYTSYPTAPHFHAHVTGDVYAGWLKGLPPELPLSLYLHVPFCKQMCWYCGCNTQIVARPEPIAAFAQTLIAEIERVGSLLADTGHVKNVTSIHFGGGTPNALAPDDFRRLMEALQANFTLASDLDLAVELDPRTASDAFLAAMREYGVTRASLGVQDFDPVVQMAINRPQPYELVQDCVIRLREAGIRTLNLDLIYGLPYQSVGGLKRTAEQAADLVPDRIALFGYAHVPWMKPHQRLIDDAALPDAHQRFQQFDAAAQTLTALDYHRIGLDHFALASDQLVKARDAGALKRNFQGYTTDRAEALIGFGPSAISSLPQGYAQHAPDHTPWRNMIEAGKLATVKGIALSDEDRRRRAVIEAIMCLGHVDLAAHGIELAGIAIALQPLLDDGLITLAGRHLTVTERGLPFQRVVASVFDAYLAPDNQRHSKAV